MPTPLLQRLNTPTRAMGAGALLALSMPPLGVFPLAWIALVPLMVRLERLRNGWTLFREAYVAFLFMAVGSGFWMLFHEGMEAALFAGLGLLLLPLPHAAAFGLASLARARHGLLIGVVALVLNVLTVEFLVSHLPGGLPWLLLGHTQASALALNQIADLGGVGLLSLFVLVVNVFGYVFVRTARRPGLMPGGRTLLVLLAAAFLSGIAVYGEERRAQLPPSEDELHVSVVQPAEPPARWGDATDWQRVERLAELSDRGDRADHSPPVVRSVSARPAPRLLVWPEAALPPSPDASAQERLYRRLALWSSDRQSALLTGALVQPSPGAPLRNAAVYLQRGRPVQEYTKVHLTPLVEQLPFFGRSPALEPMTLPTTSRQFAQGGTPVVFDGEGYRIGTVIGFESLRGDHVRQFVRDGADLVIALSDGGWWRSAHAARQHLAMTRLRAIETRRAVVMANASGTSALVHPDGVVVPLSEWMEEDVAVRMVPLQSGVTVYTRLGDWPGRFAMFGSGWFLLTTLLLGLLRKPKRATANPEPS